MHVPKGIGSSEPDEGIKSAGLRRDQRSITMFRKISLAVAVIALVVSPALGGVVDTVVDTTPGGASVDANVNVGEYVGTVSGGGGGFGGPVGGGTLSVDSDASGIYMGFSNMGDISGNSIVVYFDVAAGGFADNSTINDNLDLGRSRISSAANPLTYPFDADYGWVISPAFGGFQALFQLAAGGDNSLNFAGFGVVADPIGEFPSNPTYEFFVPYVDLGISAGDTVDFVVTYGNNNSPAFMSDEGFPNQFVGNPGEGAVTLTDFHRLVTIPEPATAFILAIGAIAFIRRRRC